MSKEKPSKGLIPDMYREKALDSAIRGEFESIDANTFKELCESNPGHATLTPYTLEQMSDQTVFQFWKLKHGKVYYGMKADGDDIELIEVINNDPELPAYATGSALLHAIERGVTCLTAFDLGDVLPSRYGRYGFTKDVKYRFDIHYMENGEYAWLEADGKTRNRRLKDAEDFWRSNKWTPVQQGEYPSNYPGVQVMRLEATREERDCARAVYVNKIIDLNIADWKRCGILITEDMLKTYGFPRISDEILKRSSLFAKLMQTAEEIFTAMTDREKKACRFEGMILTDMAQPLLKQAAVKTKVKLAKMAIREATKQEPESN